MYGLGMAMSGNLYYTIVKYVIVKELFQRNRIGGHNGIKLYGIKRRDL